MTGPKLLIVEDSQSDLETFYSTVDRYSEEKKRKFVIVEAINLDEALNKLDNSFDGAIVDLKLGGDSDAGNKVIKKIVNTYRIPVMIWTGTPENIDQSINVVTIFIKGEVQYDTILDNLFDIYQTGLTKIFGWRGHLEETMNSVFWKNILPTIEIWKTYSVRGKDAEKALLRYTVSHIIEALDNESEFYFLEEMYIFPPLSKYIKTGSIIKKKGSEEYCVVLNPACDLILYDGRPKTDRILVCLIEKVNIGLMANAQKDIKLQILETDDEEVRTRKENKINKAKNTISQLQGNKHCLYYHYLPNTSFFPGGFINFRKIETFTQEDFNQKFERPSVQISSAFIKDIISRFSSFYARQGQPNFFFDN
jgi:hypothetical protein